MNGFFDQYWSKLIDFYKCFFIFWSILIGIDQFQQMWISLSPWLKFTLLIRIFRIKKKNHFQLKYVSNEPFQIDELVYWSTLINYKNVDQFNVSIEIVVFWSWFLEWGEKNDFPEIKIHSKLILFQVFLWVW